MNKSSGKRSYLHIFSAFYIQNILLLIHSYRLHLEYFILATQLMLHYEQHKYRCFCDKIFSFGRPSDKFKSQMPFSNSYQLNTSKICTNSFSWTLYSAKSQYFVGYIFQNLVGYVSSANCILLLLHSNLNFLSFFQHFYVS